MVHYLDNAATTPASPAAARAVSRILTTEYGNPSSGHAVGAEARQTLETSRAAVASRLGVPAPRVFFTSGGTEANHIALTGHRRPTGKPWHIVTTSLEHVSVTATLEYLTDATCPNPAALTVVPPRPDGRIAAQDVLNAVRPETALISCAWVCSETGAVAPLSVIAEGLRALPNRPLFHSDGVQGFGKLNVSLSDFGVDLFTLSGHKIHAPKGVGVLYVREGITLHPVMRGGGQEGGLRPGTENLPAIAGLGAVCAEGLTWQDDLKYLLLERLSEIPHTVVIPAPDAPHIISFALTGYPAQVVQRYLSDKGIYLSVGAACGRGKKSRVLSSLKLPPRVQDSALRCSFSPMNTENDVEALMDGLHAAINELIPAL